MKKQADSQEHVLIDRSSSRSNASSKGIPFKERAFPMGNVIGVNAYRVKRTALKERILEGGYQIHETPHFLIGLHEPSPKLVVHWFAPEEIDANLGHYFLEELKPLDMLSQPESFGNVFGAVVGSLFPRDPQHAWHLFGTNTLERYHHLLTLERKPPQCDWPVDVFSTLYRRVCELVSGETLLDAGCSFGFFPLVVAERIPTLTRIVGVDIRTDPFPVTRAIAAERHLTNVHFTQANLLTDDVLSIGRFDTVVILHVLEHFREVEMYRALTNLLEMTQRRLIIAVPYEPGEPEPVYGHAQLFSHTKLEALGQWCLEHLGEGLASCEECAGGLLVVDRHS